MLLLPLRETDIGGGGGGGGGGRRRGHGRVVLALELVELAHDLERRTELDLHGVDEVVVAYERERRAVDLLRLEQVRHLAARHALDELMHLVAVPLGRIAAGERQRRVVERRRGRGRGRGGGVGGCRRATGVELTAALVQGSCRLGRWRRRWRWQKSVVGRCCRRRW